MGASRRTANKADRSHGPQGGLRSDYERMALIFQGGGALGAYQAGVYSALAETTLMPDWVAGISIGAINSAIVAGNPPEWRVERLQAFWDKVSSNVHWVIDPLGDQMRSFMNQFSASMTMMTGQPGFFSPRIPSPWFYPAGAAEATSYYDTSPLKETLEELVDFDLINNGPVRLSVGAVNVRSGNFTYFDSRKQRIGPEHIMASGALPPGFPAVVIDGEAYWDGGIVSNTPLAYVLADTPRKSTLAFQVDLFSARGTLPRTLPDVMERQKDIQYSSRTRHNTDAFRREHQLRSAIGALLEKLPEDLIDDPIVRRCEAMSSDTPYNIVHLIYRRKLYERESKDYEFSRNSMLEHWDSGRNDTKRALRNTDWLRLPERHVGVTVHDLIRDATD